ncbi:MAG TPA: putative quinol monooxygenase [Rhizomicrobium sp.]|jgi:quinol monooxygenase YgiN|nr:putative quinol monooxygenase [Rhizomicrobium sp.]
MIVVTGHATASPESFDEMRRISLEHVARSRTEPGCLEHGVYIDAENPLRLHFFERWADIEALRVHFAVPESRTFAKALRGLAADPGHMAILEATKTRV